MAHFVPESFGVLRRWGWVALATAVLGVCILGGLSLLTRIGPVLTIQVAVGITASVSVLAGIWAGMTFRHRPRHAVPARWRLAAVSVAIAGVAASTLEWWGMSRMTPGPAVRIVILLLLVAAPSYSIGFLLAALFRAGAEEDEEAGWEGPAAAVAAVAAGIAVGLAVGGHFLALGMSVGPVILVASAFLILPTFFAEYSAGGVEERLVEQRETPYGTLRVVEIAGSRGGPPERRLLLDDEEQAAERVRTGAPTLPYVVALERWLKQVAGHGQRHLFLGGGAYTLPRRIAEWDPEAEIWVVERDPAVTRIATRAFSLRPEHGIHSIHGDARAVLEAGFPAPFDHVVMDVYDGRQMLPPGLVTAEAFSRIREALSPQGTFAMNVIGVPTGEGGMRFWSIVRTVADVFPHVALYPHLGPEAPDPQNVVVVASLEREGWPDRAGSFEHWPSREWEPTRGAVVFRDRTVEKEPPPAPAPSSVQAPR